MGEKSRSHGPGTKGGLKRSMDGWRKSARPRPLMNPRALVLGYPSMRRTIHGLRAQGLCRPYQG